MAVSKRVVFFLEDSAHEAIIPPLFLRLADKAQVDLECQVLHARGGGSVSALKEFLSDVRQSPCLQANLLVVGADANCQGFSTKRDLVEKATSRSRYEHKFIAAIPDPHVERWYMLDIQALSQAAGVTISTVLPPYKCEKNYYKTLLRKAFIGTEIIPPLGGVEYGPLIAKTMDLYSASKKDHGLADFVEKTRAWLKQSKSELI
jgi:hypothetical protein